MVKKYHQTAKDRKDESRGMKRAMDSSFSDMIHEDHSAPANLPQEVIHKTYPRSKFCDAYELDDTIRGLDDTRSEDIRKIERYHSDVKY